MDIIFCLKVFILGSHIFNVELIEVVGILEVVVDQGVPMGYVCLFNVYIIVMGVFDWSYQEIINEVFMVLFDGKLLVWVLWLFD